MTTWQQLVDVPLKLNHLRVLKMPGGQEIRAAVAPADFPTHAVVHLTDDPSKGPNRKRILILFVYSQGNEEPTRHEEQQGARLKLGVHSGRLFSFEVAVPREAERVRLKLDTEALSRPTRERGTLSTRELVHYQAMSELLPFVHKEAAERRAS